MANLLASLPARRIGIGLTAAALVAATWLPDAAAASTGWQVTLQVHTGGPTNYNGMTSVTAIAGNDAWAVGGTYPSGATAGAPVSEHWNGTRWQATALPGGLTGTLGAVSAPATDDVWTVSQLTGYALHWNGTTWSVAKTWPEHQPALELTGVTAFNPADVWVFGAASAYYAGLGTWHLSGSTWSRVTGLAGSISVASALSRTNMWAIGSDGSAPDDILVRYNGTIWQQITSPALNGQQFSAILAKTSTDIYVIATAGGNASQRLLHVNGQRWISMKVPSSVQLRDIAEDGMSGEWFSATQSSSQAPVAEHRSAHGAWSSHPLPGAGGQAFGMALIPGTTSLWATGFVPSSGGTGADAVIWGYGPAA